MRQLQVGVYPSKFTRPRQHEQGVRVRIEPEQGGNPGLEKSANTIDNLLLDLLRIKRLGDVPAQFSQALSLALPAGRDAVQPPRFSCHRPPRGRKTGKETTLNQ